MSKDFMDKIKDTADMSNIQRFTRKYLSELFSILAIIVASVSMMWHLFGGPFWSIFLFIAGAIVGIWWPYAAEKGLKQIFRMTYGRNKMTEVVIGCFKIAIAFFLPFVFFGFLGLLVGTAYHHYLNYAHLSKNQDKAA